MIKYLFAGVCFLLAASMLSMPLFLASVGGTIIFLVIVGAGIVAVII